MNQERPNEAIAKQIVERVMKIRLEHEERRRLHRGSEGAAKQLMKALVLLGSRVPPGSITTPSRSRFKVG
ncbi:hypothetical protein CVCC1112_2918 [Paenarthrobacter nicotinovorans]|nr:hypothetical protein CVCC1112_2918 [Paenarthrobacter nicotinovorans]